MQDPSLVVLAAGMGSRYKGLKQMDDIGPNGETLIDYALYDALQAGFKKIVFIIREDFHAAFQEHFDGKLSRHIVTHYVDQRLDDLPDGFIPPPDRQKPWGTAHAVWSVRHVVHEPFAVINADDYYGREAFVLMYDYLTHLPIDQYRYGTVVYPLQHTLSSHGTVNRGICQINAQDQLLSVTECKNIERQPDGTIRGIVDGKHIIEIDEDTYTSMNFWGLSPSIFPPLREYLVDFLHRHADDAKAEIYIPDVIMRLIRERGAIVDVLRSPQAEWFGVTYREDKPHVLQRIRALIDAGVYPEKLWS